MSKQKPYAERLKKMKESIKENKDILGEHFPDDVTTTGNPELIREKDESNPDHRKEEDEDEKAGSKKSD